MIAGVSAELNAAMLRACAVRERQGDARGVGGDSGRQLRWAGLDGRAYIIPAVDASEPPTIQAYASTTTQPPTDATKPTDLPTTQSPPTEPKVEYI